MHRRIRRLAFATLAVVPMLAMAGPFVLLSSGDAQQPAKQAPDTSAKKAEVPPPAPPSPVSMPSAEKIVLLTRTTLLTLNDAVHTGNFTVLRDMAAPSFRDANSAARLSAVFGTLATKVDLTAVALLSPQLSEAPALDEKAGMVRLKGYFPGQPVRIDFEVIYQAVGGRWRLFGLAVQPTVATATAPPPAEKAADVQKKAAPVKK